MPDLYVDGSWVSALDGGRRTIICPADGPVVGEVDEAGPEDTAVAIDAAYRAFHEGPWPATSARERGDLLLRTADLLERDADAVAEAESEDTGKRLVESGYDVADVVSVFRHYGRTAAEESGRVVDTGNPDVVSRVVHEPVGVCGLIAPWNYPLLQASWKVAPCLAAGNTFVLKPSELTPHTSIHLMRLLEEAGLPAGVGNLVLGAGPQAGALLAEDPRVDLVSFTGGLQTGRRVMAAAAATVKKVALELGGKNPNIVFADADLEVALDYALTAVFLHSGQVCSAGARLLVEESIHDAFVDALVDRAAAIRLGGPHDAKAETGPLISAGHRDKVAAYVAAGVAEGAVLRCGGAAPDDPELESGFYYLPTVLDRCTSAMSVTRRSRSGRCSPSRPSPTRTRRSAIANDSIYGLAGAVWTQDAGKAQRVAGPAADGHGLDQRLPPVRAAGRVGRLQAVRRRPRARAGRARGVPRDQARLAQHPPHRAALVPGLSQGWAHGRQDRYDVVIVGGGSAGCALANRLSADSGTSVLVLEAGHSDWKIDPFIHMPAALPFPIGSRFYDWRYQTDPEPHLNNRQVFHARGKVLGGSSSINGMIFQRGNPMDYERWAADPGMKEWDYAHCLPYFKRMETRLLEDGVGADDWRGGDGPLVLERGPAENPLFARVLRGRAGGRLPAHRRRQRLPAGGVRPVRPQPPPRPPALRGPRLPAPGPPPQQPRRRDAGDGDQGPVRREARGRRRLPARRAAAPHRATPAR